MPVKLKADILVGRGFLTWNADGKRDRQGIVLGSPLPGYYLVQYFSWISGEPTTQQLVAIGSMTGIPSTEQTAGSWVFFNDDADLRSWLESHPNTAH